MGERRGTKALELWCRRMTEGYPGVKIDNMTTSWRDGLAFCAMIHHFRPDLIEFDKLNKEDVYYNNELAFTTAEKYLGIPALLDADDMANYEVPDRLSILTYLSQYYQVFAAQDASNRLKRSSSSEKSQISKPAGPPSKMAHVVGVPRRDPCQKCQLPVFLAERLTVGKKVFHRTCLKCARCGSQLSIGSFYETEVDDVFCCETCPDEEEFDEGLDNEASSSKVELRGNENKTPTKTIRSSIADRLAFFEQSKINGTTTAQQKTHNVLEKSVSDEEKSKDLEAATSTISAASSSTTTYKMNSALSSFLNDTIDGGNNEQPENEDSSELSSRAIKATTPMETTDTEEDDNSESLSLESKQLSTHSAPALPKTLPPLNEKFTESMENKRFTTSAELHLTTPTSNIEASTIDEPPIKDDISNSDAHSELKTTATALINSEAHKSINDLDLSATYNNDNEQVTKDINADAIVTPILEEIIEENMTEVVELRRKSPKIAANESQQIAIDKATTERLSVVRARLQQFEEITNNKTNNNNMQNNEINLKKTTTATSPAKDNLIINNANDNDNGIKLNDKYNKENVDVMKITTENVNTTELSPKSMPQERHKIEETTENEKIDISNTQPLVEENLIKTTPQPSPRNVPKKRMELKNEVVNKPIEKIEKETETTTVTSPTTSSTLKTTTKLKIDDYPEDLNPFASDDDDDVVVEENKENAQNNNNKQAENHSITKKSTKLDNSNPFDSSDDEIELEKSTYSASSTSSTPAVKTNASGKIRPPRPPPPRVSRNPFEGESDDNDNENFSRSSSLTSSAKRKTPVPTPRSNLSQSQNPTPELTPRLSNKSATFKSSPPQSLALNNSSEHYGSFNSLGATTPLQRNSDIRGSNNSLTSSAGGTVRSRKNRKAPAPPQPPTVRELFPSTETLGSSKASTPSSSNLNSPKAARKKRPAPAPPKPARLESNMLTQITHDDESKNLYSYPLQSSTSSKLSDEEKALLEGKTDEEVSVVVLRNKKISTNSTNTDKKLAVVTRRNSRRLIPLDETLLKDAAENAHENPQCDDQKQQKINEQFEEDHNVVYRRIIMPPALHTPIHERNPLMEALHTQDRQSEKLKDNKEAKNRNRQSQQSASSGAEDNDAAAIYNKSAHGKWKRRKGPAPALPIPPRKVLQMLPLQEIRHELEIIEVQQQGLEKQGVVLEKMIRDRCEGQCGEQLNSVAASALAGAGDQNFKNGAGEVVQNSKEVEDLILQLFELVNEKNELFRRQAELMYLRRQHRLEQEQADLEYEIRVLMAQPECNKTDTDKAREEALIARLVDVVQLRNEVIECLEMDRLREAEEDLSIKMRLEQHNAKRDGHASDDSSKKNSMKLSKKEKKKQKEAKKLSKNKKIDADKDADETELNAGKQKLNKKKRKFLF